MPFKGEILPQVDTSISALKGTDAVIRMAFRIGMHRDMAFIQMRQMVSGKGPGVSPSYLAGTLSPSEMSMVTLAPCGS